MVTINIDRKVAYFFVGVFVLLIGVGLVVGYGSGDPAVMGHSSDEIDGISGDGGVTIVGSCTGGQAMVGVNADGSVICDDVGGGFCWVYLFPRVRPGV